MRYSPQTVQWIYDSPLGPLHLAASPEGLCGAWFQGQRHAPAQLLGDQAWPQQPHHPVLLRAQQQLQAYFAGEAVDFDLPLDLGSGTGFQQAVWRALLDIPRGGSVAYGRLAAALGRPQASRAVGAAVGRNPVSIIVPCHRVLGAQGALTGYAGGLERKVALLQLEGLGLPLQAFGQEAA